MTPAERQRAWRARQGADVGGPRGRKPTKPCGSLAAYRRHKRHGETVCADCATVWATKQRQYYHARKT